MREWRTKNRKMVVLGQMQLLKGEQTLLLSFFPARVQEDKRTVIKARDKLSKSPGRRTLDIQRDKRPNVSLKVRLVYF